MNTTVLTHAGIVLALSSAIKGHLLTSTFTLAIAVYLDLYPLLLLIPVVILAHDHFYPPPLPEEVKPTEKTGNEPEYMKSRLETVRKLTLGTAPNWSTRERIIFIGGGLFSLLVWLSALTFISFLLMRDMSYLEKSYGFMLTVSDLRPNIGVFWYFFTEVFKRFRVFFIIIFQSHMIFYAPPFTLSFRNEPMYLAWLLTATPCIFKSYPVVADTAFAIVVMMCNLYLLLPKMRRIYLLIYLLCQSCIIGVLMWFLWIYPGSGNANFFYFQSLVFLFVNCFLIVEGLGAVRRLKGIEHGFGGGDQKPHQA